MSKTSSQHLSARTLCLMLAIAFLTTASAQAGERILESLSGSKRFAPLWPGGTLDRGDDEGFPWLRVVTDGKGGSTFVANVRPYKPAIDASGKFVKVWVKLDDLTNLGGLEFRLSSDRFNSNFFAFEIPLYDDEDTNVLRDGVWTTLTFSFGGARVEGKPDRSAINSIGWYVSDKGNEAPVSAHWGGMSLIDEPSEGVVSITFDDGYDEHHAAAQLMAKYRFAGTAYVIPDSIGESGYMTLHQLVDLQERFGWDVAAHHETPFTDMRPGELENAILGVQRYLGENEFGAGAGHLAYPLGKQNTSLVRPLVRKHFTTARGITAGPETLPPADPHLLRIFNVTNATTAAQVGEAARKARENKEWLILMLHYLVDGTPETELEYSIPQFKSMLDALAQSRVRVLPMSAVWEACGRTLLSTPDAAPCAFGSLASPAASR